MKILVTGGVKSGKSSRALEIASSYENKKTFLATAIAFDDEMKDRIKRHKQERAGLGFSTIEETININKVICNNMIVDCIPMWMNNIFFEEKESFWENILTDFIVKLPENIVIVTNEIGMGLIPPDPVSRRYEIALGRANAMLAKAVDHVELMVSGIALKIK